MTFVEFCPSSPIERQRRELAAIVYVGFAVPRGSLVTLSVHLGHERARLQRSTEDDDHHSWPHGRSPTHRSSTERGTVIAALRRALNVRLPGLGKFNRTMET